MRERGIFCNRTLNLRSIKAIGYDMDYTLIHYRVEDWERRAYEHLKQGLAEMGWPVDGLEFDPQMICRGLVIDTHHGNILKTNRFGFIKRAQHGTQVLDHEAMRTTYARTIVDLSDRRWVFLNTLYSLSEGCMYAQLVDRLDQRRFPEQMTLGYEELYRRVRGTLDNAHMEGRLKAEIISSPDKFVVLDSETPLALLDQRHAGKKLMLITNSEWGYSTAMMSYAFDRFLPKGMTWRDLFDVVIVSARKPEFFTTRSPFFEVATEDGLLRPSPRGLRLGAGAAFFGGSAVQLEKDLGISGDEILYVGDHMFADVHVTKSVLRWRTALIIRELEEEIRATDGFRDEEARLASLMDEKQQLEDQACLVRVELQRLRAKYGPQPAEKEEALHARLQDLRARLEQLDLVIAPLAKANTELSNPSWGLLMRAGNDKSDMARLVERYADIYTSRVSNLLYATPYVYLRSPRGSLPHDPSLPGGKPVTPAVT